MKDERIMILNMVNEGKINAEEASKLLEAIKGADFNEDNMCAEEKINKFSQSVDNFTKEFAGKMENVFNEMEPKIKKATKTVVEKTASVLNDMSKSLNEGLRNKEENGCCGGGENCNCNSNEEEPEEPKEKIDNNNEN